DRLNGGCNGWAVCVLEDRGSGRTEGAMRRRIVLDRRGHAVRFPVRFCERGGVSVVSARANGRVGSPEVVVQLAVPTGNVCIHQPNVQQGEESRGEPEVLLRLLGPRDASNAVPANL